MIVAIDGGVASGKSVVGRRVADHLELPFVDSGLMYRAVAALAQERSVGPEDGPTLRRLADDAEIRIDGPRVWAGGQDLSAAVYAPSLNSILAAVAANAGVREVLVARQRNLVGDQGLVMAGRDIGTVVFPGADHKFFLVAGLEERMRRRLRQLTRRGEVTDAAELAREVVERDRLDSERQISPLRAADDADVVETDGRTVDEVVAGILSRIRGR